MPADNEEQAARRGRMQVGSDSDSPRDHGGHMTVANLQPTKRGPTRSSRDRVELILNHLDRLPALPGVVARLIAVTSSEDASARDVVAIIESDAALTAGILRMMRRADLGVRVVGMTVQKAVTLLGLRTVRNAALSSQFFETLSLPDHDAAGMKLRTGLWEHSLAVACSAELIAQRMGGGDLAGDAFVCGLLHDVGKIALDVCLPKSYAKAFEYARDRHVSIADVENEVFGLDHTVAGKRLATRWQLPQAVQDCIWLHHQNPDDLPTTLADRRLVQIVHAADHLVRGLHIGISGYGYTSSAETVARFLDLSPEALMAIAGQLPERMRPIREVLGLTEAEDIGRRPGADLELQRRLSEANARLAADNERLLERAACLDAVERFTAQVGQNDLVGDVCAFAARIVAESFQLGAALVYVQKVQAEVLHGGWYDRRIQQHQAFVLDHAGANSDDVWRAARGETPPQPLTGVALRGQLFEGVALLFAEQGVHVKAPSPVWQPLWTAITRAIGWSSLRSESETMTQELLDLNRRCREAEAQVVRMRSISMVGEMAAGAAHELNNPLAVISGRAQMELEFALEPERRRAMEIIVEQAQKASQIVLDLMNFAKPDPPQPRLQTLSHAVQAALQRWKQTSPPARAQVVVDPMEPGLAVYADAHQFHHILAALIDNAATAVDGPDARVQINSPSKPSDETVRIVVSDNGPGMAPEVLEHALDPFFSHRPAGRGRGMGLTQAYRLAEINGGRLWIDSKPNQGTKVTIELPAQGPAPSTS